MKIPHFPSMKIIFYLLAVIVILAFAQGMDMVKQGSHLPNGLDDAIKGFTEWSSTNSTTPVWFILIAILAAWWIK